MKDQPLIVPDVLTKMHFLVILTNKLDEQKMSTSITKKNDKEELLCPDKSI